MALTVSYVLGNQAGYKLRTGFVGKTLWDWMELLIVPLVLAIGGLLFNWQERKAEREIEKERAQTEREIATDRQQEAALQMYLGRMTKLLLENDLRTSEDDAEERSIARAQTLATLRGLDGERKGILVKFLHESGLISQGDVVVDLDGADLSGADLFGANLVAADLHKTDLSEARLAAAELQGTDLSGANLSGANLSLVTLVGANLRGTNLRDAHPGGANLRGADLSGADLGEADPCKSGLSWANLSEAKYNLETKWPKDFDPIMEGAILKSTPPPAPSDQQPMAGSEGKPGNEVRDSKTRRWTLVQRLANSVIGGRIRDFLPPTRQS